MLAGQRLPGLEAAVVFPDGSSWTGSSGLADVAAHRGVTPTTLFSVGSITKTLVAALTLRLADQGLLGLDDPITRWLPRFPDASRITLRELLSHRSGVADFFDDPACVARIIAAPQRRWTAADDLACVGAPEFQPGARFRYSNTGYVLVGLIDEAATGQGLGEVLDQEFVQPYGFGSLVLQQDGAPAGPLAHGYLGGPTGRWQDVTGSSSLVPYPSLATAANAAGSLAADASDLARWVGALFGGSVLEAGTLAQMTTFQPTAPDPRGGYGLGVEPFRLDGWTAWGHRGHLAGFWALAAYLPDKGVAVAVLSNAEWANPDVLAAGLIAVAIGSAPAPSPSAVSSGAPATGTPAGPSPSGPGLNEP